MPAPTLAISHSLPPAIPIKGSLLVISYAYMLTKINKTITITPSAWTTLNWNRRLEMMSAHYPKVPLSLTTFGSAATVSKMIQDLLPDGVLCPRATRDLIQECAVGNHGCSDDYLFYFLFIDRVHSHGDVRGQRDLLSNHSQDDCSRAYQPGTHQPWLFRLHPRGEAAQKAWEEEPEAKAKRHKAHKDKLVESGKTQEELERECLDPTA